MPFTREKFLSLAPRNRAKKMADLLKAIILTSSEDAMREYSLLNEWNGGDFPRRADHGVNPSIGPTGGRRQILDAYISWRREAGMGPEDEVLRRLTSGDRGEAAGESMPWEVLLHDLRSGHNTGSIIRTADAMGLRRIHLSGYTPGPESASVASAAMGAQDWMDIARTKEGEDVAAVIGRVRERGGAIIALEIAPGAEALGDFAWPEQGLLILGNEELGVPANLLDMADAIVAIPMYGRKASLNVANAFALAAWEMRRAFEKRRKA